MRRSKGSLPGGPRRHGIRRAITLVLALVVAVGLSGCLSPTYRFVASTDRDVVFRLPRDWSAVDAKAVLKASGVDPASRTDWVVYFDGAPRPSVQHIRANTTSAPVLMAQSFDITAAQRPTLTDDELRNLLIPVTQDARAAAALSAGITPASDSFTLLKDQTISTKAEHGVHLIFTYKVGSTYEYFDQVAVTNPKKTRGQVLIVHCAKQCFSAHAREIDSVVSSLTVK